MAKELLIKEVNISVAAEWDEIHENLDRVREWRNIDVVNWAEYDYCPQVCFRMAYCDWAFLIQYKVKEQSVRAVAANDNGEVWKDSCVEFFVSPADDGLYYNFEFNCIGTCLLAVGASRNEREAAQKEIISQIRRQTSLEKTPFAERKVETEWDLTAVIPYSCFFKHRDYSPDGKNLRANFYKCGDELSVPHFLSWNPIKTENPDFHRPDFFGTICLDSSNK